MTGVQTCALPISLLLFPSHDTGAITSFTGTGTVRLVVNCLLPFQAHDEIVLWASELLAETVENFNRQQMKMMERKEDLWHLGFHQKSLEISLK